MELALPVLFSSYFPFEWLLVRAVQPQVDVVFDTPILLSFFLPQIAIYVYVLIHLDAFFHFPLQYACFLVQFLSFVFLRRHVAVFRLPVVEL